MVRDKVSQTEGSASAKALGWKEKAKLEHGGWQRMGKTRLQGNQGPDQGMTRRLCQGACWALFQA